MFFPPFLKRKATVLTVAWVTKSSVKDKNRVYLSETKQNCFKGGNSFLKDLTLFRKEVEMKIAELLPLKVSIHFSNLHDVTFYIRERIE